MREDFVEAVLDVVAGIPAGRVLAYGDIAELLGVGGPRQVGAVMSHYGGSVPWWRVIRASGEPPRCHEGAAEAYYRKERTPLAPSTVGACRVDIRSARWHPDDVELARFQTTAERLRAGPTGPDAGSEVGPGAGPDEKMSLPDDEVEP